MAESKVKITWHNRLEKFASDLDKALGTAQQVIEWDSEDIVSQAVARSLGFDVTKQEEVTEHGTNNRG